MIMKILQRQLLLKQTLFGLSWVGVGALLPFAEANAPVFSYQPWLYILLAFLCARFAGMNLNRLIDRHFDAQNARTKDRPLPKGEITPISCFIQAVLFLSGFVFVAWLLNPLCFFLSFFVVVLIVLYSYTKRFTFFCHFVLGAIHFFAPVSAWAAVTGTLSVAPILLGVALFLSIAAGDIIYACQDIEFDRKIGLHSIPAAVGCKRACLISRYLHIASVICLWVLSNIFGSPLLYLATSLIACLYASSHVKLGRGDFGFDAMFSFINTLSGVILFVFTLGEMLWHASW